MLAFKYRFHGHGSLRYVYTHGQTVRTRLMTLKYSTHPKRKDPRVAVVISKKVIKGAIGRNRVRRRIYEIIRHEIEHIEHNKDIVFIVFSSDVLAMPSTDLVTSVRDMLRDGGVYKK